MELAQHGLRWLCATRNWRVLTLPNLQEAEECQPSIQADIVSCCCKCCCLVNDAAASFYWYTVVTMQGAGYLYCISA